MRGEVLFSIGYSEPGAGTDLASLTTRAVRDGDDWVITGQKMWTSLVDRADYVWLACRTDPDAPKHKGISMIIVPTDSDGFSWTKVDTIGGGLTSATYYQDVRVPVANTVGEVNGGWRLMTARSSTRNGSRCPRPVPCSDASRRCGAGRSRPSSPTVAGSSTRSGCSGNSPRSARGSRRCGC